MISIDHLGPIEHCDIPTVEGGGVVVLRGENGSGKTHALAGIEALATGERLPVQDGATRGAVEGWGMRITIGRRTTRRGALEVRLLEGEDPSLIVDPRLKDPEVADAARLRALLRLVGAQPRIDTFAPIVSAIGDVHEIARPETIKAADLPDMAARLKRDLEAAARLEEGRRQNHEGEAAAHADDREVSLREIDLDEIRAVRDQAVIALEREEARAAEARKSAANGASARAQLDAAEASYDGPTVDAARTAVREADGVVDDLRHQLADAERHLDAQRAALRLATAHASMVEQWRRSIDEADVSEVDDEHLEQLRGEAAAARSEHEDSVLLAQRQAGRRAHDAAAAKAAEAEARAGLLRDAAMATETVISEAFAAVAPEGMVYHGARLWTQTSRGRTLFAELSDGERWSTAIGIACRVGCQVLVVPQHAYEALDPANRDAMRAAAQEHGVTVYTAEATDGELRAEVEG